MDAEETIAELRIENETLRRHLEEERAAARALAAVADRERAKIASGIADVKIATAGALDRKDRALDDAVLGTRELLSGLRAYFATASAKAVAMKRAHRDTDGLAQITLEFAAKLRPLLNDEPPPDAS